MAEAGIRELRDNLSRYIDRVREGEEIVVTAHGTAVARVVPIGEPRVFDRLVDDGVIRPARDQERSLPELLEADGSVSALVADQRR